MALLVLLALIALIAFGVTSLVRALTTRDTAAPAGAAAAEVDACRMRDVTLEVAARDIEEGQPGDAAVTFTNEGETPCTLEAGRDHLVLRVTSGTEPVWDSRACEAGPRNRPLLLDAGASSDIVLTWDGTHGGRECAADAPVAEPGTYRYEVSLDDALVDAARVQVHPAEEPKREVSPSPTPSLEDRPSPAPGTGASPGTSSDPGDADPTEGTATEDQASGQTATEGQASRGIASTEDESGG